MRKVIEGKAYDTDTADVIIALPCPHVRTDFKWSETRLYPTTRGAYFLADEGGALSRWAKATQRRSIAGEGIEVIAKNEARACAKHAELAPDRFARFGFARGGGLIFDRAVPFVIACQDMFHKTPRPLQPKSKGPPCIIELRRRILSVNVPLASLCKSIL